MYTSGQEFAQFSFFYLLFHENSIDLVQGLEGREQSKYYNMEKRGFKVGVCNHIYQRTRNRFNIFYDQCDFLSYYSIFGVMAVRYNVQVLGLCIMIDHLHMLLRTKDRRTLSGFVSNVTSVFVRQYNDDIGRTGPLFEERFGSALKSDRKKLISAIIYLGNNPVEKRICSKAEEYRWNFIAYMSSSFPFSVKINRKKARNILRKALRIVDWHQSQGKYLTSSLISELMRGMTSEEKDQLVDHIIVKYNVIDYDSLLKLFGSYEQMLTAIHSTTGSEYDLDEYIDRLSDSVYQNMILCLRHRFGDKVRKVTVLSSKEKFELADYLHLHTSAHMKQIFKFLHMAARKV